ncbi:MAG: molecular chaperone DnaK [Myxococcota bacterium]|nr:molecular chaperone DnaK [Myxococcota bacterium]
MGKTIGIDLGTTNSCVAVVEGGQPQVITNREGSRTTPSVVGFATDGGRLVGQIAKRQAVTNAESTLYAIKRLIGKRFDEVKERLNEQSLPYDVKASPRGDAWVEVRGDAYSPPEISAVVLEEMKRTAEEYLGEDVTKAVITVPAYFNDSQRQATRDAGRIAGLEIERIVNEPTAAALAYGLNQSTGTKQKIAVYDLGGGTFDISILEISDGVFNVLSTNGDTNLGGEDFDYLLVRHLVEIFKAEHSIDLSQDRMAMQRIKEAAERAKHDLSAAEVTDINLPFIASNESGPKHLTTRIARGQFESMASVLVERSLQPCRQALADAQLKPADIDEILMVGGMTRMPLVQSKVSEFFNKKPNGSVNPDEVVAIGASIQGAVLSGEVSDVLLLDVTPLSLGVETAGGVFTPLIARNTTVPTRKSQVFSTAVDNQPMVNIHVLQGERPMAEDNQSLARFEFLGIPPAPRGVPQIEVTFELDANGIVNVSAKDLGSGKVQSIRVTSQSGLTQDEIDRILNEAESQRDEDDQRRELASLINRAETLLYTTKQSLEAYGEKLESEDIQLIEHDMTELRTALDQNNLDGLEELFKALEVSAYRIAEALYGTSQS